MLDLQKISTEGRNPASAHIDEQTTLEMLHIINAEDKQVALAVGKILPSIAEAVDVITKRLAQGGRLFYLGAGTSGRLGILDASECPPTYGVSSELVQGVIAGGMPAIFKAQEGAEDNPDLALQDLAERKFSAKDVLVGIAASGRTPYVIGGLQYARKLGAATIALACSAQAVLADYADIALLPVTGAEVVTGSTRMKAGTAQKLVLNMLSTATMIKLGKVYGNLMVDVKTSNAKLEERARRIVMEATGCSREESIAALQEARGNAKLAIYIHLTGAGYVQGQAALAKADGHLGRALRIRE
ncbi:MAG: N-acetylmuramic acid 6-phosphate etherase [Selenomonas sp.]|uniref:N-acetylmuramic acid 6-phosphate etherase n=1 Tax=Selenomonas sp. TaxID=2053611 RepID=UPI0025FE2ADB|nr:N-acetylmuramic acid 6-phosphate etherase [Selenomonas sp.]MCR5757157.1 N-acetylmuramic acid 6-phosphate etherase [Selenomonas sp.]